MAAFQKIAYTLCIAVSLLLICPLKAQANTTSLVAIAYDVNDIVDATCLAAISLEVQAPSQQQQMLP